MKNLCLVVTVVTVANAPFALAQPVALAQPDTPQVQQQIVPQPQISNVHGIRQLKVGNSTLGEVPVHSGDGELLAPILSDYSKVAMPLNAWLSRADRKYLPASFPLDQSFQVNQLQGAPIVLSIGQTRAFINNKEHKLGAAPLIISGKIWLPVLSLTPFMGVAVRLAEKNTLHLTVPETKPIAKANIGQITPKNKQKNAQRVLPKGKGLDGMTVWSASSR